MLIRQCETDMQFGSVVLHNPQFDILQRAQLQAVLRGAAGAAGAGRVPARPRGAQQVQRRRQLRQEGRQEHLPPGQHPKVGALFD